MANVPELMDCDRCTLFFVDRLTQQLIVRKNASGGRKKTLVGWVFGQSEAPALPFPEGETELRLPMKGLAGVVAASGQSVKIDDVHLDGRFDPSMDKETGYRTRSMLCVPMIDNAGECIGVIQAINKNLVYPGFDSADEALLLTFSAQAALAVRNSQLLSRTSAALQQADALLEITNVLSSELKMEALISLICTKLQQLLGCERCTVFLVDKEKSTTLHQLLTLLRHGPLRSRQWRHRQRKTPLLPHQPRHSGARGQHGRDDQPARRVQRWAVR